MDMESHKVVLISCLTKERFVTEQGLRVTPGDVQTLTNALANDLHLAQMAEKLLPATCVRQWRRQITRD